MVLQIQTSAFKCYGKLQYNLMEMYQIDVLSLGCANKPKGLHFFFEFGFTCFGIIITVAL